MARETGVQRAISRAESILPGVPAPDFEIDPRWQAILRVSEFIDTHPEEVWEFARRWGRHAQADLRAAVGTCLLEHLLQEHFDLLFVSVRDEALASARFAATFELCWWNGQARLPENAARIERLKRALERQRRKRLSNNRKKRRAGKTSKRVR